MQYGVECVLTALEAKDKKKEEGIVVCFVPGREFKSHTGTAGYQISLASAVPYVDNQGKRAGRHIVRLPLQPFIARDSSATLYTVNNRSVNGKRSAMGNGR